MGQLPSLTASEGEFWRAFALVLHTLPRVLEGDLQAGARISSPEYTALQGMADDRDGGLRINDLANLVGLSASRTSRLADGLVARGEAIRQQCSTDRRSQRVTITDRGLDRLREAKPCYLDSVRRRILDQISPENYEMLTQALRTLVDEAPTEGRAAAELLNVRGISA